MPTRLNSTHLRIERSILGRLALVKGDRPFDVFISDMLDVIEPFKDWTDKDIDEFIAKFQPDNSKHQDELDKLIPALKAVIELSHKMWDVKKEWKARVQLDEAKRLREVNK